MVTFIIPLMDNEVQKYVVKSIPRVHTAPAIEYEKELNAEQLDAVRHGDGYSLVLAGAGSGKTRTLVYRVAWLIEHGIPADRILLLTFTNKAAGEMLARVSLLLKDEVKGIWGGTFHHAANRILRHYAVRIGFQNNFQILDQDDALRLMKSVLSALHGGARPSAFPKADAFLRALSYTRNSGRSISETLRDQFPHFLKYEAVLSGLLTAYQERKKAMNAMDFDDLLVSCVCLLEDHADVRASLARRFQYVLVDEYQDTNRLQALMTRYLSSVHHNLLVVGDDAQSIYSFRAADVGNILDFTKEHKGARVFRLETNYRSRPEILHLANASIRQNEARYEKELRGVRPELKGLPTLASAPDPDAQAAYVIEQVQSRRGKGVALRDFAVLFRASFQTLELELALTRADIPYVKRGGLRYFEQAHVKDVLSFLRILANPLDELAWKRMLTLYKGVGEQTAEGIWQRVKDSGTQWMKALKDAVNDRAFSRRAQRGIGEAHGDLEALMPKGKNPGNVIEEVLARRYREYAKELFEDAEDRILDLETLAGFASRFDTIQPLLAEAALGEGYRGEAALGERDEEDRLVLSTIHQAKGLEWHAVFVIGLIDGHFPHQRTLNRPHELEEERRLFYVAVTRAKDELFLTYPETSSLSTGFLLGRPSLFVRELPKKVYERWIIEEEGDRQDKGDGIEMSDEGDSRGILDTIIATLRD